MKGSSHAIVGAVVGGAVSIGVGNDVVSTGTATLAVAGMVAGLVPDLDTNGKLSNKITISHKFLKGLMSVASLLVILYSILTESGQEKWYGILLGIGLLFISGYVTQRRMLLIMGIGITLFGIYISVLWVVLGGLYVAVASRLGHRTYTHSVIGLVYFGYVAYLMNIELQVTGLFLALVLGYISHLVCDFKVFNKQGVKLLRPFSQIEI